jgi:hypothetical protein
MHIRRHGRNVELGRQTQATRSSISILLGRKQGTFFSGKQTTRILLLGIVLCVSAWPVLLVWHSAVQRPLGEPWEIPSVVAWNGTFSSDTNQWAVFYNLYIPFEADAVENALQIVAEQVSQIGRAAARLHRTVTIYYNTIGNGDALNAKYMKNLCWERNRISCQHLQHYEEGHEERTLQMLYQYCDSHNSSRVLYMHSKGTFHPDGLEGFSGQNRWRRHMMEAVTSKECLTPTNAACDCCGLLFQPLPGLHFTGNMWTAKCSYIKKLIPPEQFAHRMSVVLTKFRTYQRSGHLHPSFFPKYSTNLGRGRYASEHWLASHPSVLPCDASANPNISYWMTGDRSPDEFVFDMAPRFTIEKDWYFYQYGPNGPATLNDTALRMRDYALLPGQIMKWYVLYNEVPPDDSWIWRWFPDGPTWRLATNEHKRNAVKMMTRPYRRIPGNQVRIPGKHKRIPGRRKKQKK